MSKKENFYKLIEKQNVETKEQEWEQIRVNLALDERIVVKKNKTKTVIKWMAVTASSIVMLFIGIFLIRHFMQPKDITRYCTVEDYFSQSTDITLKQYSETIELTMLYYSWYDYAEAVEDIQFILKDTGETICHKEKIMNGKTGQVVTISAVKGNIVIEEYKRFIENCADKGEIQGMEVNSMFTKNFSYAWFEYNDYTYFIEMEALENKEAMDILLGELLVG